ncbi:acyl-CoA dehydrogenase family protein [Nocardia sp. NPDC057353]|uniref:acyl-CoA dehydrogenase family protein n=1 Tax=Nocardia sp. NPDC057353 TaxID=3346104 RepID=UPI00363F3611
MSDHTLAAAAVDVAAIAGRCAAAAEENGRLDPDVVRALVAAGFARHFVPTEHGGAAGTFTELMRAVATIGEVCTATAWCASLSASMTRMAAAFLPPAGAAKVFADGPDAFIVGSVTPLGKAEVVDGGWRLSGRWQYISAVEFSDWALLCGLVDTDGAVESKLFAVPRSGYSIDKTWHNIGMRATGSDTVIVEDQFVPTVLAFDRADLFAGRTAEPAEKIADCYSAPLLAVNGLSFVVPALGAARGAQRGFVGYIAGKIRTAPTLPGVPGVQGNRNSYDGALARTAAEIDAVGLLLDRAVAIADQGAAVTPLEAAQNLRDCAVAIDLLVTAVDRIFRQSGTTGQSLNGPLQRIWRDVNSISTHMAIQFEPAARGYSEQLLKL